MRLADLVIAAQGGDCDQMFEGAVTSIAKVLANAQRYELTDEVVAACRNVSVSKPSSILSALRFTRMPYPDVWIERQEHPERPSSDPQCPHRVGCLIESAAAGAVGMMTFVWSHSLDDPAKLTVGPMGVRFDWREHGDLAREADTAADRFEVLPVEQKREFESRLKEALGVAMPVAEFVEHMRQQAKASRADADLMAEVMATHEKSRWRQVARDPAEVEAACRLLSHSGHVCSSHCAIFFLLARARGLVDQPGWADAMNSWNNDILGEYAFFHSFVCLLNARHGLTKTIDNPVRINRRRVQAGKRPLSEFIVTRLDLARAFANRSAAVGLDRAAVRQHLCSGHFKTRKSGIFWWSPHLRGKGPSAPRDHYRVLR
jgi:hypothetical protein